MCLRVPKNWYVEILTPFERRLGHESGALLNGISGFMIRNTRKMISRCLPATWGNNEKTAIYKSEIGTHKELTICCHLNSDFNLQNCEKTIQSAAIHYCGTNWQTITYWALVIEDTLYFTWFPSFNPHQSSRRRACVHFRRRSEALQYADDNLPVVPKPVRGRTREKLPRPDYEVYILATILLFLKLSHCSEN